MADGAAHVGNVQDATLPATLRFAGHTGPLDESARPVALGRYEVREILGHGGFGSVYLGFDTQLRRKVAIKVPRYEGLDALGGAVQFLQEARRLAQLNHPGIVTVHDVGVEGTQCYIVSEYIEGTNLSAWLKQSRPTFEQTARIVAAVAEALAYAHSHGIVHRDVKPGNVLLTGELVPILVDFGLALSEDEASQAPRFRTVGTPPYSSPEQERGEGHRIDGRTDVYSLGVVLYQMLTGRLPFRADELDKLRRQICEDDPQPPRQLVRTIPRELERICLKAMAKRISDRYSTAGDMAEELRLAAGSLPPMGLGESRVVAAAGSSAAPPASHVSGSAALGSAVLSDSREVVRIVPKGLRSFGAEDSEFFLQLLPGPRDRDGLPDSVHFWKQRIESSNPETNFAVGLIYGPSGCGKSSFVKAGLLPRVDDRIASVYVEATREDTEARLTKGLRRVCPELDPARSLKDTLAALRRSRARADRQKVLIVLDQFEQWLHVHGEDMEKTELVAALRQADGEHVQVILMVRDDFWLGITRLFDCLEINLDCECNTQLVDLLDLRHAKRVLLLLGHAFEALPDNRADLSDEQKDFLDHAATELSQDGRVIAVRLSLFAELMKERPWTRESLVQLGGTEGVGVRFLEETFTARTAIPDHRALVKPVRALLQALLPEVGTDIKGHMRSRAELAAASGLAEASPRFTRLIQILDRELHIITPTEMQVEGQESRVKDQKAEGEVSPASGPRPSALDPRPSYYQLTHDFLIPPLRLWLTLEQRKTWRGRAELCLEERAAQMSHWPQSRYLPTFTEFLAISFGVSSRKRRPEQRVLMREATRYFGLRASATVLAAILLTVSASQGLSLVRVSGEQRIEARVDAVVGSTAEGLLPGIMKLEPLGEAALPRLREKFAAAPAGSVHQLHAALALALLGEPDEDFLVRSIALAPAKECRNILTALRPLTPSVVGKLLDHANVETQSAVRARYAITLLQLGDPRGAQAALALVPDPQYRTAFIHGFDAWHANLSELVNLLRRDLAETLRDNTGHPALRSGLCAALGTVDAESLEDRERKELVDLLRDLYTTDPDGGTHNAAGWALWKWTGERPSLEFPIGPSADRHWFISPHGLTLLEIPLDPGRFTWQKSDTGPHEIELTRIFYACDRGVPQRLFLKFLDEIAQDPDEEPLQEWNQDEFMRANTEPDHPVRRISWFDAVRFCNWLSRKEGKQACYTFEGNESKVVNGKQRNWPIWRFDRDADGYRLPTAAESEYACRAGSATQYFFGDDRDTELLLHYGWFAGNSGERVHAGGEKPPNGWGLFDVYGNLLEWCWDWQWEGSTMTQWVDPLGPPEGTLRVTRGHFFGSGHSFLKGSASRFELRPDVRILGAGFRVVCGPPSPRH